MGEIDWHDLINNDPDDFDRIAREHIESKLTELANGDEQRLWKLRKLQNSIDKELNKYINPIARYNKMVELFYKGFDEFRVVMGNGKKMNKNSYNKHSMGLAKEKQIHREEKRNPLQKIIRLINEYYAIDLMYGTPEEKKWAKDRLYRQIMGVMQYVSEDAHVSLKASLKSKDIWESTREKYS